MSDTMINAAAAFTIIIGAIWSVGWWATRLARARHGGEAARRAERLDEENDALKGQVRRLEERLAVLETIATDPAERTAREIEQLR